MSMTTASAFGVIHKIAGKPSDALMSAQWAATQAANRRKAIRTGTLPKFAQAKTPVHKSAFGVTHYGDIEKFRLKLPGTDLKNPNRAKRKVLGVTRGPIPLKEAARHPMAAASVTAENRTGKLASGMKRSRTGRALLSAGERVKDVLEDETVSGFGVEQMAHAMH